MRKVTNYAQNYARAWSHNSTIPTLCLCSPSSKTGSRLAALLRVPGVTASLAKSNGSLPPGLWLTSPAGRLPKTGISSGTLCSVIEYLLGYLLPYYCYYYYYCIWHVSACSGGQLRLLHPFNGLISGTTWVSQYQKGKTSLDLNGAPWLILSSSENCLNHSI